MARVFKDANGVTMPVRMEPAPAQTLPTAAEQVPRRSKTGRGGLASTETDRNGTERTEPHSGRNPIGEEEIAKAKGLMKEYFENKRLFDINYRNNFDIYNLLYNEQTHQQFEFDGSGFHKKVVAERIGAQTLNVILNKHADAMDNYPEAVFLPRSRDDEETAKMLNAVVPCVLERNHYEKTYSETWTDKLVGGADCVAVVWDAELDNGLGDIAIRRMNLLDMAWAPFVDNIQESPHLFVVSYSDVEEVKKAYPKLEAVSTEDLGLETYTTFQSESKTKNKAAVVDWYYKTGGVLHFCKFCGSQVIFASENEGERYAKGFYHHGKYPFKVTPCFSLRDTPVGFGFIDICRTPQQELDALRRDILKNVRVNSQPRNLVQRQAMVNANDLSDLNKKFIEVDGMDLSRVVYPLESKDIAPGALSMYQDLKDEIKDTTGTNDPSNGAGAAGVTSGSAIAALQEAGGKISRDINKGGFREFEEICYLIVEEMRQFYNPARLFRVVGEDNQTEYVEFDNEGLQPQPIEPEGVEGVFERLPVFDIKVKAQRSSPFTTAANNQMMIDMFRMGAFAPENADAAKKMLEGMSFEGKDKLLDMVKKDSQLLDTVKQLSEQLQMANAMLAEQAAQAVPTGQGVPPIQGGAPAMTPREEAVL